MRTSRRVLSFLLIGGLITSMAACGSFGGDSTGSPTGGTNPSATAGGDEPPAALIDAAKKEGQVVFYAALNNDVLKRLGEAFKAKYGISLVYKESASGPSSQLAAAQIEAGNVQVDVISITPNPKFQNEHDADFATFTPEEMPTLKNMPAEEVSAKFIQYTLNYYGYVYNSDLVKEADLPKDLQSLATDPAFRGKIGTADIAASNSYATYHAILYDNWGAQAWESWIRGVIGAQDALVGQSSAALGNQVASGAISIFGPTHFGQAAALIKQGAPLAIKYYDPVMQLPNGLISFVKAPHPNAAKLFINWMVSQEAQEIICGGRLCASYLNLPDAIQKPTGVEIVEAPVARGNELADSLTATFKGGGG
jgi:iron(III) transport system substrate-binding protein